MHKKRCPWCETDPLYIRYHDEEWGTPVYDDRLLFEFLILEGMQAGLSWLTILRKRPAFRKAFSGFDPQKIAGYSDTDVHRLMANKEIIRNRSKIRAAITNAHAFLKIQKQHTSFATYIWSFTEGKPKINQWTQPQEVPCSSEISDKMAKDLKQKGFSFVGTKICYAFMQAVGMVDDHLTFCFRHHS